MQEPFVVILIGPPGAGKGTQAELLQEELGLVYVETSKIIEANVMQAGPDDFIEIDGVKYSLSHERELWVKGILCTPEVVSSWIRAEIKNLFDAGKSLVLAGSPRTLHEAKEVIPLLEGFYGKDNLRILNIQLPIEQSIWRNVNRRVCSVCRHPVPFTSETQLMSVCPKCGGALKVRKGLDEEHTIRVRLKEYAERTAPILQYAEERGYAIAVVNGDQNIERVFTEIKHAIK